MRKLMLLFGLILTCLFFACQGAENQRIVFVKDGKPFDLEVRDMQTEAEGYLQAAGEQFSLQADKAIYGDNILVNMKLSLDDSMGHIVITVGDNAFAISSEDKESEDKRISVQGPSIGKNVALGEMSDFIRPDVPFELAIAYKKGMLSYTIDDKPVFSQNTVIPPGGLFGLFGYDGNFRVYDVICEGQFKTLAAFYTRDFLLERAQTSVAKAAERVKDDPNRPAFHFQPPANWNNDPNGLLFHDGFYHLFYQHNPYSDRWDWMHWGHARSTDMVHWQRMPIALWPDISKGERHCFSGSGFITDEGKPILFYTSIGHENPEHWAAVPVDEKLEQWQKHQANPIIVMEDHGTQFIDGWRDPFLFREAGDTYMVIGGHPRGGTGSIMLYKALNPELTEWLYLGVPFSGEEKNWECPNFFKIENKDVLIYSPHSQVKYITGTMDFDKVKFTPEYFGSVDNGSDWNYYAPNTLQMADGRRVLFGWIPRFKENQGWQGAISLPRDLAIDAKGRLIQTPVPELENLRGEVVREENIILQNTAKKLAIQVPQFEMKINIAAGGTDQLGFRFNDENGQAYEIKITPQFLYFGEEKVAIEPQLQEKIRTVQFFFDRTIVEIILNDGVLNATEVIYPDKDNLNFEIFSPGGKIGLASLDVWNMNTIW